MAGLGVWVAPLALADKDKTTPWASMDFRLPPTTCLPDGAPGASYSKLYPPTPHRRRYHRRFILRVSSPCSSRETLEG